MPRACRNSRLTIGENVARKIGQIIRCGKPAPGFAVEVSLHGPEPAVNGFADVLAFAGFRITTAVDADLWYSIYLRYMLTPSVEDAQSAYLLYREMIRLVAIDCHRFSSVAVGIPDCVVSRPSF